MTDHTEAEDSLTRAMRERSTQHAVAWTELCEQYEGGDVGDVEFVELAMDLGVDLERIEEVLQRMRIDLELA